MTGVQISIGPAARPRGAPSAETGQRGPGGASASSSASAPSPASAAAHPSMPEARAPKDPVGGSSSLRKAAIVLVSLEQSLASRLLSHLDRAAVELVTWEIARLDDIRPEERAEVLEEFYELGLRRLCFVFDDLVRMNDQDVRAAYHEEDGRNWALALAGASAVLRAKVFGALSTTSAEDLRRRLEALGPFRLSDSEAAQADVADRLRRLHDQGRICLPAPTGHDGALA